jgi:ADP-ribose pyrophosphatase YjhB (NUDIX family)
MPMTLPFQEPWKGGESIKFFTMYGKSIENCGGRQNSVETCGNQIHGVQVIVFNPSGKVLLGLRSEGRIGAHEWGLLGGKITTGEQPKQAIIRELGEEVGDGVLLSDPDILFFLDTIAVNGVMHRQAVFICQGDGVIPTSKDMSHTKFDYFSLLDLPKNVFLPSKMILSEYINQY